MHDTLRTTTVSSAPDFAGLGEDWDGLLHRSTQDTVFSAWDWVSTWWQVYGPGKELAVTVVRVADEPVGIAPLYRPHRGAARLLLLGSGESVSPDYLSFIARRDLEKPVTRALLAHVLADGGSPLLDLREVPERSALPRWLQQDGRRSLRCSWASTAGAECPYTPLPESYAEYERGLSANMRSNLRRRTRRLRDRFGAQLVRWHDEGNVPDGMAHLGRLHRLRWQGRADRYSFSDSKYREFHARIAERFQARGWLRLYGLRVGEAVIAAWYGFRYGETLYYYQSGFDPEWERHSPGLALMGLAIKNGIEEGVSELDLLKGAHEYKRSWAGSTRRTQRLLIAPPGAVGWLRVAPVWLEEQKRRLKARLSPRTLRCLRHLRSFARGRSAHATTGS